jgi:alanine racemase
MHRLGFQPDDVPEICRRIKEQSGIVVRSTFSHLVGSDDPRHDAFTMLQFNRFEQAAEALEEGLQYHLIKHILNSAGIERFPEHQMDMVRLGIGYMASALPD